MSAQGTKAPVWETPTIRPLFALGQLTTPTTYSASSPDKHSGSIEELQGLLAQG